MPTSREQKKVVIAGGSRFLGVSLAHPLAERGATVVMLSRSIPPELREALQSTYTFGDQRRYTASPAAQDL